MKHIKLYEEFASKNSVNEGIGGLLPDGDYPVYVVVQPAKTGDTFKGAAVLPAGSPSAKYQSMNYVLEELRKHYGMSKGDFPTNKMAFDRYRMKNMMVTGTTIQLNWGPQNKGFQLLNMYSPNKSELEEMAQLIAQFAKK